MKTIAEVSKKVIETAPVKPEIRDIKKIEVGQWAHQGDIAILKIEKMPTGKETKDRQLAPGATKGSRHCLADFVGVVVVPSEADELTGPAIEAEKSFLVTHPEHAHYRLPAGLYQVIYQRNLEKEEIARVRD